MLSRCSLDFSVGVGSFVIGLSQISSFVSQKEYHPVFYRNGDLVYKLKRVKDTPNFIISSGSKRVKILRRRQYDPLMIKMTIGLVIGPSTALYRPFLKYCTVTNKAVGAL